MADAETQDESLPKPIATVDEIKPKKKVPLLGDMLDLARDEATRLDILNAALGKEFGRQLCERDRWALETYEAMIRMFELIERGRKEHEAVMRATRQGKRVRVTTI